MDLKKFILVLSVRDQDGYYIPILSVPDDYHGLLKSLWEEWKISNSTNEYWDLSIEPDINAVEFYDGKKV